MKNNNKFNSKKAIRIRIIVSVVLLILFAIGWIMYGLSIYRTSDKTILNNFFKNNNLVDKIDIEFEGNYINYSYEDKNIGLYKNDNILYLYGNNKYVDVSEFLKSNGLTINVKEFYNKENYKVIDEEIQKIIIDQYNYVDVTKKYLEVSDVYEYDYSFNTSYLVLSMSGNKTIMETLTKMFNCDNQTMVNFLKKYFNDKRLEYTIMTKGKKRKILSYNINIEDIFSYYSRYGVISGGIGDLIYYKSNDQLLLLRDEWEKEIKLNNNVNINFEEYEKIEYDGLYNLIK